MPLLPSKIEKLLNKNNYALESIFVYMDICRYIRVISLKSGECFLLYVDPEFEFKAPADKQIVNMKIINFETPDDSIVDKFHEYPATADFEDKYRVKVPVKMEDGDTFEDKVETKYKHKIFLKDMEKPKILTIKSCFRQLQRLSLMTQDLQYNLCIFDGSYMLVTENNDIINCYQISTASALQVSVVVGLEFFYKNIQRVEEDVITIKKSLYNLVSKNHTQSFESVKTMIDSLHASFSSIDIITQRQLELDSSINKTVDLLEKVTTHLSDLIDKYKNLETSKPREDVYVHEKNRLENNIKSSEVLKQKLLNYMVSLKEQKDRMFLSLDQIEFDTTIFMNGICKRMKEFDEMKK
jgi:hypothetical protein